MNFEECWAFEIIIKKPQSFDSKNIEAFLKML
jgi:hypothetical protein